MRLSTILIAVGLTPIFCLAQSSAQKIIIRPDQPSSGVVIGSKLSKQQKENLFVLAKTWGFLKYYHPDVAKGNYNFDSCLFSILTPVVNAKNKSERDEFLFSWINTLGDENKYPSVAPLSDSNLHTKPNLIWLSDKNLFTEKISKKLNNIYLHRNQDSNYYAGPATEMNVSFAHEASYKSMKAEDDGFRMLALFRYWNMVEYFFPYKHLFKQNYWMNVLEEFIPQFASKKSELDYRLTCWRLINQLHDTHASIYRDSILNNWEGMKGPAIDFKTINKKIIVRDFLNDSLGKFETLKPGDEIVTVNGKSVEEIRKYFEPYLCASNQAAADRNFIWRFLFFSNDDSLNITYKRDGKIQKAVMRLYFRPPYQNGDTWRMPMYKLLSNDIGYINIGKIKTDSLPVIFKTFQNTKGIIIDIRNYPNEFMPFAMGKYLKPTYSPFDSYSAPDYKNPGAFKYMPHIYNGATDTDHVKLYNGEIVILVNEQTQSSAEYTTMALRSAPRAVVMGSQTAGADGDISRIPMPGGFNTLFSGLGIFYPDGKDTQGVGIVPDVYVYPTQKGISLGKDEVLEKAKEYVMAKKSF